MNFNLNVSKCWFTFNDDTIVCLLDCLRDRTISIIFAISFLRALPLSWWHFAEVEKSANVVVCCCHWAELLNIIKIKYISFHLKLWRKSFLERPSSPFVESRVFVSLVRDVFRATKAKWKTRKIKSFVVRQKKMKKIIFDAISIRCEVDFHWMKLFFSSHFYLLIARATIARWDCRHCRAINSAK